MDLIENVGRRSRVGGDQGDFIDVGIFSVNGYERNALFERREATREHAGASGADERYVDVAYVQGCDLIEDGRGLGLLDFDGDGDIDLVVNNYLKPAALLVNRVADRSRKDRHWVRFDLDGVQSNRDGVGARVVIEHGGSTHRTQTREVMTAAGYLSGQSPYLHFGLGADARVDRVIVHWPSGHVQEFRDLAADEFYRVREDRPVAAPRRTALTSATSRAGTSQ